MSAHDNVKTLLIVYHTQSGASAQLARAAWRGAQLEQGGAVSVLRVWDASTEDIATCDGLLLVAAENSGSLSGGMKDFLDRTFYPAIDRGLVIPVGVIISAGNDGRGAERQLQRILSGYPFPVVAEPLIVRGEITDEHTRVASEFGQALAAGVAMGIY